MTFASLTTGGNQPKDEPIIEGGPVGYFSTLPIRAIVDRINNAHIPAAISNSAGAHLCNRLFYSVMHTISIEGLRIKAGFIHVPYLHDQAINKYPDVPSLSRDSIVEAVRLAIEVSLSLLTPHA
jgi:pyroglutamyl-peptidase